ncbi:MAG: hypothetical protein WCL39_12460 [Armatimonadota bacterium]
MGKRLDQAQTALVGAGATRLKLTERKSHLNATNSAVVDIRGKVTTNLFGEKVLLVDNIQQNGYVLTNPFTCIGRSLDASIVDGCFVKVCGVVQPGSMNANTFTIWDGYSGLGADVTVRASYTGSTFNSEGDFVVINGAAGKDAKGRLIYIK